MLGRRLYLRTGWRTGDTHYLGNLSNPLTVAAKIRRLAPRPIDVRRAVALAARALAMAMYLADTCRDSPRHRYRTWQVKAAAEEALQALAHTWPTAAKAAARKRRRHGKAQQNRTWGKDPTGIGKPKNPHHGGRQANT